MHVTQAVTAQAGSKSRRIHPSAYGTDPRRELPGGGVYSVASDADAGELEEWEYDASTGTMRRV